MKSPLDRLIEETAEFGAVDEGDARRLLESAGIDVEAACRKLDATIARRSAALRRKRLDAAQEARLKSSKADSFLQTVRELGLSVSELISRIAQAEGAVAHRDFRSWSKEDLESELADLMAVQARGEEGQE